MTRSDITPETVVCRSDSLLSNNLGEDVVMMDIDQGAYYGLEDVAASIWKLIEEPVSIGSLSEQLMSEYDVAPERCEQDVTAFVGSLVDRKIVRIVS